MTASLDLRMVLPARPENLTVIRQAVTGFAEACGMDPIRIADLKTVVTEAASNVVMHAYGGDAGPLELRARRNGDQTIEVVVSDRGGGLRPHAEIQGDASLGLGLPLIASLSDGFTIRGRAGLGTEVSMHLALTNADPIEVEPAAPASDTAMEMASGTVKPVLARVLGALGARANFSVDQLSDALILGDAISARGGDFADHRVGISIADGHGSLELRVGPLRDGAGERMLEAMDVRGHGASLRKLARRMEVVRDPGAGSAAGEFLLIEIPDQVGC